MLTDYIDKTWGVPLTCARCESTAISQLCGACNYAVYCGSECQAQHWDSAHRLACIGVPPDVKKGCLRQFYEWVFRREPGIQCDGEPLLEEEPPEPPAEAIVSLRDVFDQYTRGADLNKWLSASDLDNISDDDRAANALARQRYFDNHSFMFTTAPKNEEILRAILPYIKSVHVTDVPLFMRLVAKGMSNVTRVVLVNMARRDVVTIPPSVESLALKGRYQILLEGASHVRMLSIEQMPLEIDGTNGRPMFPPSLRELHINSQRVTLKARDVVELPVGLEKVALLGAFNLPVNFGNLISNTIDIAFGNAYNQPTVIPAQAEAVIFGRAFVSAVTFLPSDRHLAISFGPAFHGHGVRLPPRTTVLELGGAILTPDFVIPDKVRILSLTSPTYDLRLPRALRTLALNDVIDPHFRIPEGVTLVSLRGYVQEGMEFPSTVRSIIIEKSVAQNVTIPRGLDHLKCHVSWYHMYGSIQVHKMSEAEKPKVVDYY